MVPPPQKELLYKPSQPTDVAYLSEDLDNRLTILRLNYARSVYWLAVIYDIPLDIPLPTATSSMRTIERRTCPDTQRPLLMLHFNGVNDIKRNISPITVYESLMEEVAYFNHIYLPNLITKVAPQQPNARPIAAASSASESSAASISIGLASTASPAPLPAPPRSIKSKSAKKLARP
jgi:hypothetical protein